MCFIVCEIFDAATSKLTCSSSGGTSVEVMVWWLNFFEGLVS